MLSNIVFLIILISLLIIRFLYVMLTKGKPKNKKIKARILIVIGSGGHTTEMLRQVKKMNPKFFKHRLYVMADSDQTSECKIITTEGELGGKLVTDFYISKIPRSRAVNQSYISSIFTTIYSTLCSIPLVVLYKPHLILCNGPGTCIPICLIGFLSKVLFISDTSIIFIESICRVKTLSLSGKLLLPFADKIIVQWPQLHKQYPTTDYLGLLL